ncbi:histidine ammonia-lyase [Alicyclobacillus fastidiosus]
MSRATVVIDEEGITFESFYRVVYQYATVDMSEGCTANVVKCRTFLEGVLLEKKTVYGVNTGFGKLSNVVLPEADSEALQVNLLRSHACAVGEPFPTEVVRAMMLLRLVSLARGFSGVRLDIVHALRDCLNAGVHPIIPSKGSLGASGDLAPLAHLALCLIGEGDALYEGRRLPAQEALLQAGIQPVVLQAKEGLALINGTQAMMAVGLIAYRQATAALGAANTIAAITMEALNGIVDPFAEPIQRVRPYPEQASVAKDLRTHLEGSQYVGTAHAGKVQDAYSLRCVPQVHGASLRALRHIGETLFIEMNSATDNPLLFPDEGLVYSGGNFHGQPVALAMDYLKIAVSELANISERRTERLVNPQLNEGLPAFLTPDAGRSSGMMILQYVAASLVSENKVLAHPASVDSIPSSANQEDHVSMGTIAARQAAQIVDHAGAVLAIELICATQALEWKESAKLAPATRKVYGWVRKLVPGYVADRSYSKEIETLAAAILQGQLTDLTNAANGVPGSSAWPGP